MDFSTEVVIKKVFLKNEKLHFNVSFGKKYQIEFILTKDGTFEISKKSSKDLHDLNAFFKNSMKKAFAQIKDLTIDKIELFNIEDPNKTKFKAKIYEQQIDTTFDMKFAQQFNSFPLPIHELRTSIYFRRKDLAILYKIISENWTQKNETAYALAITSIQMIFDSIVTNRKLHWFLAIQVFFTLIENKAQINEVSKEKKVNINGKDVTFHLTSRLELSTMYIFNQLFIETDEKTYPFFDLDTGLINKHAIESLFQEMICSDCILTNISAEGIDTEGILFLWNEKTKKVKQTFLEIEPKYDYLSNHAIDLNIATLQITSVFSIDSLADSYLKMLENLFSDKEDQFK